MGVKTSPGPLAYGSSSSCRTRLPTPSPLATSQHRYVRYGNEPIHSNAPYTRVKSERPGRDAGRSGRYSPDRFMQAIRCPTAWCIQEHITPRAVGSSALGVTAFLTGRSHDNVIVALYFFPGGVHASLTSIYPSRSDETQNGCTSSVRPRPIQKHPLNNQVYSHLNPPTPS